MIDEKRLIEKIEKMFVPLSTPDGRESIDIRINGYNECLVDVLETIKEQPKVGEWIPFNKKETKEESQKKKDYIYVALMKEKQNEFFKK